MADEEEPRGWTFNNEPEKEKPSEPAQTTEPNQQTPEQPYQPSYSDTPESTDPQSLNSIFDVASDASYTPPKPEEYSDTSDYSKYEAEYGKTSLKKRILILAAIFVGMIGAVVIGLYAYRSLTGVTAGASTPEGVVTNTLSALSDQDLLGAARQVDPYEIEPFIENYDSVTTSLKENKEITDEQKPLEAYGLEYENIETKTVMYTEDVARVELVSGSITTTTDVSKLPKEAREDAQKSQTYNISEENERWQQGELYPYMFNTDDINPDDLETENMFYIAVRRDGRWYASSLYSWAEAIRITGNAAGGDYDRPNFDPLERVGNGAKNPEAATVNFIEALFGLNTQDLIKSTAPEHFAVAYDYMGLLKTVDERNENNKFVVAARDAVKVSDIDTEITSAGTDKSFVAVNAISMTLKYDLDLKQNEFKNYSFIPYKIDASGTWDGQCVSYEGIYSNYISNDTRIEDMPPYEEPASGISVDEYEESLSYTSEETGINEKKCFKDKEIPAIGVVTIAEEGKYYVSPMDTLWHYVLGFVQK